MVKLLQEGYRLFIMKIDNGIDFFEFSMTVLKVWPLIIEISKSVNREKFCYTFRYVGKKLNRMKGISIC